MISKTECKRRRPCVSSTTPYISVAATFSTVKFKRRTSASSWGIPCRRAAFVRSSTVTWEVNVKNNDGINKVASPSPPQKKKKLQSKKKGGGLPPVRSRSLAGFRRYTSPHWGSKTEHEMRGCPKFIKRVERYNTTKKTITSFQKKKNKTFKNTPTSSRAGFSETHRSRIDGTAVGILAKNSGLSILLSDKSKLWSLGSFNSPL